MKVTVHLARFVPGKVRTVTIPDNTSSADFLDTVFHYGQNDVQPLPFPSVSVGDIIENSLDGKLYQVEMLGFKVLPAGSEPYTSNPLKYQSPHIAHPIPPELDKAFRDLVGRGITPADQEGIHTSPNSEVALTYTDGSDYGVVLSLDVRGLQPELEFEQIVLKRLFLRERRALQRLAEDLRSIGTEDPESILEEVNSAYETLDGDVNPATPFLRITNGPTLFLEMIDHGPTTEILFQLTGCKRYLTDIDFDRIVEVELIKQPDHLRSPDQITSIYLNPDLQKVARIEYHGTSLAHTLEAFPALRTYLPKDVISPVVARNPNPVDWTKLPRILKALDSDPDLTVTAVAKTFGISDWTLRHKLKALGHIKYLGRGQGRQSSFSEAEWKTVKQLMGKKLSIPKIAKAIHRPYSTLVYAMKQKGLYDDVAAKKYDVSLFNRAVALLRADSSLSIAHAARRVGITTSPLRNFLHSAGLLEKIAARFKKTKKPGTRQEKRAVSRKRSRSIRLQIGDIYRDIRNDDLFIAVTSKILLGVKNGEALERMPSTMHQHEVNLSVQDLADNWGLSVPEMDKLVKSYWNVPLPPQPAAPRGHKYVPIRYRIPDRRNPLDTSGVICDFCGKPGITHIIFCHPFMLGNVPRAQFATCSSCLDLINTKNIRQLVTNACDMMPASARRMARVHFGGLYQTLLSNIITIRAVSPQDIFDLHIARSTSLRQKCQLRTGHTTVGGCNDLAYMEVETPSGWKKACGTCAAQQLGLPTIVDIVGHNQIRSLRRRNPKLTKSGSRVLAKRKLLST